MAVDDSALGLPRPKGAPRGKTLGQAWDEHPMSPQGQLDATRVKYANLERVALDALNAHRANTGAEPSVSIFERAMDRLEHHIKEER